jgi:hypothetical protein
MWIFFPRLLRLFVRKATFQLRGGHRAALSDANAECLGRSTDRPREVARAVRGRRVQDHLTFRWAIAEGDESLQGDMDQEVEYGAPTVPGVTRLRVTVTPRGLPGYSFERAAGERWRCRFDAERNIIVVNTGHRDFVFATRSRALQLRYLVR